MLLLKHILLCFTTWLAHAHTVRYTTLCIDVENLEAQAMESKDANDTSEKPHPKALVCLYAQRDEPMYRELQKYLILWKNQSHIYWADPAAVQQADLVLLLLSPDFFATAGCLTAMGSALQVRTERSVPVVPVLARTSDWKESDCGILKALPDNERPIAKWEDPESAYENICAGLARVLPDLPALGIAPPEGLRFLQAPKLPEGYVARPTEFAAAKHLLLHRQGTKATAITTALRGAGGFGKTTLALALCHDSEIQAAFPDGILWVELGEHPPGPRDILNGILASLEPSRAEAATLEEAKKRWQAVLHDRVCLLVIDDVWQAETLLPLLEGGPHCRRLVTTRNDLLLPRDAARVLVDAMEPQEAVAVLCQGLPEAISQAVYQPTLETLAARLGCWPLLLTLANGLLTDLLDAQMGITEALATVAQAYQTRGVTAFRLDNVEERQQTVDACLSVSLQHLEMFTHAHYHARERCQELAVFPEDTDIPLATLQVYWKGSAGLQLWETEDLCVRLHRLSLLLHCDLGTGTIRLHDVVRSYLIQRAGEQVPVLHRRLLQVCQQHYHLARWADLPQNEDYLWHRLIYHLCQAGTLEALQTTLTDLSYLTRKALYVGVSALEADLLLAMGQEGKISEKVASSFFVWLHRTIVQCSHLLRQARTLAEIGGLLLIHLGWEPAFAGQQLILERELPRPFLTALHPLPAGSSSALLRTLHGHIDAVNGCAVSPDGRFIVSASDDYTLKIWDAATGEERLTLAGHIGPVSGCAISPDSRFIVSASWDRTLKVWDAATGEEHFTLAGHTGAVNGCAVSPDGRFIVSASNDFTLKIWDAATGEERLTLPRDTGAVISCVVSPNSRFIVSAAYDDVLKVWDVTTGEAILTLPGHRRWVGGNRPVSSDWFSEPMRIILSSSKMRDLSYGEEKDEFYEYYGIQAFPLNGCAVSPDGRFIVSASDDRTLKIWDAATGEERLTLAGHTRSVSGCTVSPDGRFIVSASWDHTLKVWDAATGEEHFTLANHTDAVNGCAVSPDGRFIVSASDDRTLKVWDATRGEERPTFSGHTSAVNDCAVSPDGRFIVSASDDRTLKIWDAATGEERLTLAGHTRSVSGCTVSPDGRFIVSASDDYTLKVWDAATGEEHFTLAGHTGGVRGCAMSPDGTFIISASLDRTLRMWDMNMGKEHLILKGHIYPVTGCAVSQDGRWIISISYDHTLKVWDATTGKERLTLAGHKWITTPRFVPIIGYAISTYGHKIVSTSVSSDRTLKIWDSTTGEECLTLSGHTSGVSSCAVSPNGTFIISVSSDGTLKLWNTTSGVCLLTFPMDDSLHSCAFYPDGERLVVCGEHGVYFLRLVA